MSLQNGISINSSKSQSIVISRCQIDRSSLPKLVVDHNEIPYIKKVRNLGITINGRLTWDDHVGEMYKKNQFFYVNYDPASNSLFLLLEGVSYWLWFLILTLFTYVVFCLSLNTSCQRRLTILFNYCARYIFGIQRFKHISQCRLLFASILQT